MVLGLPLPFLLLAQGAGGAVNAAATVTLPPGTPMWLIMDKTVPMRVGQHIEARLQYGVYAENKLALPANTVVEGTVTGLHADTPRRRESRLRADFTPFSKPVVRFEEAIVNSIKIPLQVTDAVDGAPVMNLTPPPPRKGGFIRAQFDQGVSMVKDRISNVTAPGKRDRLVTLLYSQLPYHPQRVIAGTAWTVDTTAATAVLPVREALPAPGKPAASLTPVALDSAGPATWTLQTSLEESLTSAKNKVGDPIRAVVVEPVLNPDGSVAVPQGAVVQGTITKAKRARRFALAGDLRFNFNQLVMPGETRPQEVQTTVTGVDAAGDTNLSLDREGQGKPKPQDKVVVPLILFALAASPLDHDRHADGGAGKNAGASNSLGTIGFILGTAVQSANLASGIGFYGTALATWNRWIKRADDTTLHHDTRMVIQTTARRSAPLRAAQVSQSTR